MGHRLFQGDMCMLLCDLSQSILQRGCKGYLWHKDLCSSLTHRLGRKNTHHQKSSLPQQAQLHESILDIELS